MADTPEPTEAPEPEVAAEPSEEPAPSPAEHLTDDGRALLDALARALGDAVLETAGCFGEPVARVRRDAWARAAEVAKHELHCDYLSFVSGIDWMPRPVVGGGDEEAGGDTSAPVQPTEMTFGVAGSAGRFQVVARVQSTARRWGLILKADVDETDAAVPSWVGTYPGADWHERECWEMFGFRFDGHPSLRHLYLPSEFEGHPLRKDFPLLAREVKPWPGLVDVEPMPGDDEPAEGAAETEGASA